MVGEALGSMRTKVEKRRVRHDSLGAVGASGQGDAGVNSVSVLSSGSVLTAGGDKRDGARDGGDRRMVSRSEAERLAAANHVVVALGPPVVVGPRGVLGSRREGAAVGVNLTTNVTGSGGHHIFPDAVAGAVVSAVMEQEVKKGHAVSPPIKKPPKKRRNNEKKGEVVMDLVSNVMVAPHGKVLASTELLLPPNPTSVFMPQLQQPPMTPPTPSPQHSASLSPPQQGLSVQSPYPLHTLVPPHQTVSVVSAMPGNSCNTNGAIDNVDSDLQNQMLCHTERLSMTDSEAVLPAMQTPFTLAYPLVQAGLMQTVAETFLGESTLPASTSLLQPPTWLLTPQEIPMATDGVSASEHSAASDPATSETDSQSDHNTSSLPLPSHPSLTSSVHSLFSQGTINPRQKSNCSGNGNTDNNVKSKNKKKKTKSDSSKGKAKTSVVSNDVLYTPTEVNGGVVSRDHLKEGSVPSEGSQSTPKPKKPPKKRPLPLDENVERRIANIEETIDRVIANLVYNCDDLSNLAELRQAQCEQDAKESEDKAKAKEAQKTKVAMKTAESKVTVKSGSHQVPSAGTQKEPVNSAKAGEHEQKVLSTCQSDNTGMPDSGFHGPLTDSQKNIDAVSSGLVDAPAGKKKTVANKSKKKADAFTTSSENASAEGSGKTPKAPKKKTAKKKMKADGKTQEDTQNFAVAASEQTDKGECDPVKETTGDEQPSPPKKKKKASKAKGAVADREQLNTSQTKTSDVIPNGHIESTSTDDSPKPAKKKKSKPKMKKALTDSVKSDAGAGVDGTQTGANLGETAEPGTVIVQSDDSIAQSADGPSSADKPSKPKPKKAKKRKSDVSSE